MKKILFAILCLFLASPATAMHQKTPNAALISAMNHEKWDEVRSSIDQGADINTQDAWGDTPLHRAAYFGDRETVLFLLKKGANKHLKNKKSLTPADLAKESMAEHCYLDILRKDPYSGTVQKFAEIVEILKNKEDKPESL